MQPLTPDEIHSAWHWFERGYRFYYLDLDVRHYLNGGDRRDWLRQVRIAKQFGVADLNRKVGNFPRFEKAEKSGRITIRALRKCAEAMDCELVYAIRPKNRTTFCRWLWDVLYPVASKNPNVLNNPVSSRGRPLALAMEVLRLNPQFRKEQGWRSKRESLEKALRRQHLAERWELT